MQKSRNSSATPRNTTTVSSCPASCPLPGHTASVPPFHDVSKLMQTTSPPASRRVFGTVTRAPALPSQIHIVGTSPPCPLRPHHVPSQSLSAFPSLANTNTLTRGTHTKTPSEHHHITEALASCLVPHATRQLSHTRTTAAAAPARPCWPPSPCGVPPAPSAAPP